MSTTQKIRTLTLAVVLLTGILGGVIISGTLFSPTAPLAIAQDEDTTAEAPTDYVCYRVVDESLPAGAPNALIATYENPDFMGLEHSLRLESTELYCAAVTSAIDENAPAQVYINEFESNPEGADSGNERIELFNPSTQSVDISGWQVVATAGVPQSLTVSANTVIPPLGLLVVFVPADVLNNVDEIIELRDSNNVLVDSTSDGGPLSDEADDDNCWARVPNGTGEWVFQPCTLGQSNE